MEDYLNGHYLPPDECIYETGAIWQILHQPATGDGLKGFGCRDVLSVSFLLAGYVYNEILGPEVKVIDLHHWGAVKAYYPL